MIKVQNYNWCLNIRGECNNIARIMYLYLGILVTRIKQILKRKRIV